jgi:hypothetical protein
LPTRRRHAECWPARRLISPVNGSAAISSNAFSTRI